MLQVQKHPDHGVQGPVDHLELLVLSLGLHVYSTKTLACITVPRVGCLNVAIELMN